jgi:hypothetical protein
MKFQEQRQAHSTKCQIHLRSRDNDISHSCFKHTIKSGLQTAGPPEDSQVADTMDRLMYTFYRVLVTPTALGTPESYLEPYI